MPMAVVESVGWLALAGWELAYYTTLGNIDTHLRDVYMTVVSKVRTHHLGSIIKNSIFHENTKKGQNHAVIVTMVHFLFPR